MHVLMVAAENDAIPSAKVGGIADVIRDLPPVLTNNDISVDVVIPAHLNYNGILNSRHVAKTQVNFAGSLEQVDLYEVLLDKPMQGNRQFIIQHPLFSSSEGIYSHDTDNRPFARDANKYALFSLAVCHFLNSESFSSSNAKQPDVIHLHDWHSATVAVLCHFSWKFKALSNIHSVFTIHNIALQGIRPFENDESSLMHWFPELMPDLGRICDPRYPNCYNPMRAGINLCDKIHLVSPTYAREVTRCSDPDNGFFGGEGLEYDLVQANNQERLVGILNGCDYQKLQTAAPVSYAQFIQAMDKQVKQWLIHSELLKTVHYLANERLQQWKDNKQQGVLVTSVGRLTNQKALLLRQPYQGTTSLSALLSELSKQQSRMIILGSGDQNIELEFMHLMATHDNFLFLNGYAHEVSDLLYQHGQLFLMPSSFEPCGISQMLAMRSGQPCLVHSVGGLKDTVEHMKNGFCFEGKDLASQTTALQKQFKLTLSLFKQEPEKWQMIVEGARVSRFSWQQSIKRYINELYLSSNVNCENVA